MKANVNEFARALLLAFTMSAPQTIGGAEFYVSLSGSDDNSGSSSAPFHSLSKARDVVRAARLDGELAGPVAINIAGGTYRIAETLKLNVADRGSAWSPVVWQADQGTGEVRFVDAAPLKS